MFYFYPLTRVGFILADILILYALIILIDALLSWTMMMDGGRSRRHKIVRFIESASGLMLKPIRRVLGFIRLGNMYFDLSPIIALLILTLLSSMLAALPF